MTWEKQANKTRKNTYFNLIKIKKITSLIDNTTKHLLLKALVFLHINYCLSGAAKSVTNKFDSLLHNIDKVSYIDKSFMDMANF